MDVQNEDPVDVFEEKLNELDESYKRGDIPYRFNEQFNLVKQTTERAINLGRDIEYDDLDGILREKIERWFSFVEYLLDALNQKADSDFSKYEEAIQALGQQFFRRAYMPGVSEPLALVSDDIAGRNGRNIPIMNIESVENDIDEDDVKKNNSAPVICLSEEWRENPELWPLFCHEFAHVVSDSKDILAEPTAHNSHREEFFADLTAAYILGPSFLKSMIVAFEEYDDINTRQGLDHPQPSSRITAVRNLIDQEAEPQVEEITTEIWWEWYSNEAEPIIDEEPPWRGAKDNLENVKEDGAQDFNSIWSKVIDGNAGTSPIEIMAEATYNDEWPELDEIQTEIKEWFRDVR